MSGSKRPPLVPSDIDEPFNTSPPPGDPIVIDEEVVVAEPETVLSVPPPPSVDAGPDAPVVLVVEDDAAIRSMIVKALGLEHTVYEASDGEAAAKLLEQIPNPSAMVCDVMMPKLDGFSLVKALKKDPGTSGVPIIFLTAKDGALDVVEGINAGARHYIAKPFKMKELLDKVRSVVGKPSGRWKR